LLHAWLCCGFLTGTGSTTELLLPVLPLSFFTKTAVSSTSTGSAGFSASTCGTSWLMLAAVLLGGHAQLMLGLHLDEKLHESIME